MCSQADNALTGIAHSDAHPDFSGVTSLFDVLAETNITLTALDLSVNELAGAGAIIAT